MKIFKHYSRQGLWTLFLACAFPIHVWAIILIFNDVEWIAERSNFWDSIGVASYGLVFAFAESWLLFLTAALLGFLVSMTWSGERRVALMSTLATILTLWAIAGQLYFFLNAPFPESWIIFFASLRRPLRFLYAAVFVVVLPTVVIPTWLILKFEKPLKFVTAALEKISLLTSLYLFFDLVGFVVLVFRNL
ncbi:hypothetical protein ANAEL_00058 [Anaerolineales bacterium]|nr:hypothetical protein ANAEL_00058 [Anaerolineales bacterium]